MILVTGANGFLGKRLMRKLKTLHESIAAPDSAYFDLRKEEDVALVFNLYQPSSVIHLAANVGGIEYNNNNPATLFYDNLMMGTLMFRYANLYRAKRFISIGTVCSYPASTPVPFTESNLWNGYPEETNAPYGLAKKMMLVQAKAYHKQYNFHSINLILANLYGPEDEFEEQKSHVIPALIKKFIEAKDTVEIWGTGQATREFLYVDDAVDAIIKALTIEKDLPVDPINIGTGVETSIASLVSMIHNLTEFSGTVTYNPTCLEGQQNRRLDVSKAKDLLGFETKVDLLSGLKTTIDWYQDQLKY